MHDSVSQNQHNTMPHLDFIGNSPLRTSGQMSEDDDAERATVDAAAAFVHATLNDHQDDLVEGIFGGEEPDKGNEVGDLGELPPLHNIWDCPYLNKIVRTGDDGKSYAGWTCGWCPCKRMALRQNHFGKQMQQRHSLMWLRFQGTMFAHAVVLFRQIRLDSTMHCIFRRRCRRTYGITRGVPGIETD